jgi:hypothetical protein
VSREHGIRLLHEALEDPATSIPLPCLVCGRQMDVGRGASESAEATCPMRPGRFALGLGDNGDWTLVRRAA